MQRASARTPVWTPADTEYMQLALAQARAARGRVAPNPPVGAVVVRDGRVLAVGATRPPPGPHAEVVALAAANEAARGATLYVTLEPCAHVGRTPPCVEAVLRAGIQRVVLARSDPNPLVNGRGIAHLRAAGLRVEVGLCAADATELVAGFAKHIRMGRPRVTAKYAMTLDGRIATRTGHARWVSGPEARAHAHQLRDQCDAILIGVGTLLADDPLLTTRLPAEQAGYGGPRHPLRVVLDTHARALPTARMLASQTPGQTLVLVGELAPAAQRRALETAGAEVVTLPCRQGRVDPAAVLDLLGARGVTELLVEGGGAIHGAFFDAQLVERVVVYIAPTLVGGREAPAPLGGQGVACMSRAARVVERRLTTLGADLCLLGLVVYPNDEEPCDV